MHHLISLFTLGLISQTAEASYDGPEIDHVFSESRPSTLTICEQPRFNTSLDVYKMCTRAQQAAESFAEQLAGQEGSIQGYLRGYTWGLYSATKTTQDDASLINLGAQSVDSLREHWASSIEDGTAQGNERGYATATSDVIKLFRSAVNTGKVPSQTMNIPNQPYDPDANAYLNRVRKSSALPTAFELLSGQNNQRPLTIFTSVSNTFIERSNQFPQHFWYTDNVEGGITDAGIFKVDTSTWDNMDSAFELWKNHPSFTGEASVYSRYLTTQERASTSMTPTELGNSKQGALLSDLYKEVFTANYQHWANHYFSQSFKQQMTIGQRDGETLGTNIGTLIAKEQGLERAFNARYVSEGKNAFLNAFNNSYTDGFKATHEDFLNNPHLEVNIEGVVGTVDDGIIQPGESIRLEISVTNIGGQSSPMVLKLSGNVQNTQSSEMPSLPALTSEFRTTTVMGHIDARLQARESATIKLTINDTVSASTTQVVNRLVEIVAQELDFNTLKGSGQITVTAQNLTTKTTIGDVSASLNIDGQSIPLSVGPINAGQSKQIRLAITNLNPLTIIEGKQKASVTLYHSGEAMDTQPVSIQSANVFSDLVTYFDQVVNGTGSLPSTVSIHEQIEAIIDTIQRENNAYVSKHNARGASNMFKHHPQETLVGLLSTTFASHPQSEVAIDAYDRLAQIIIKETELFDPVLGMSGKRCHYRKLVRSFSTNKRLK